MVGICYPCRGYVDLKQVSDTMMVMGKTRVLAVDDEDFFLRALERMIEGAGRCEVVTASDSAEALSRLDDAQPFDVALVDHALPGLSGLDLLAEIKHRSPETEVVVMTAYGTIERAVEAMRAGAYDFLTKPFDSADIVLRAIERASEHKRLLDRTRELERQLDTKDRFEEIVAVSRRMRAVLELVDSVAPTDATVLLLGESGTGKELLARAIHRRSRRQEHTLLAVNCSALTETLLESELFGHMRGSFTGATASRRGLFEEADRGTLFLDEVGEMVPSTQVKLLRALQEGEIRPVGANDSRKVNVRVVAATNRDLRAAVAEGRFREDLFYRLNVVAIEVPPLRDRLEDVPPLAQFFLRRYAERSGRKVARFAPEVLDRLLAHRWPGNVRELENAVERAVVLCRSDTIRPAELPPEVTGRVVGTREGRRVRFDQPLTEARRELLESFERNYLEDVLSRSDGRIAEAARLAGMDRSNLRRLLHRYQLGRATQA